MWGDIASMGGSASSRWGKQGWPRRSHEAWVGRGAGLSTVKGVVRLVCPVCEKEFGRAVDWCGACGAYLGYLQRHPRRVRVCVVASIVLGSGLFAALGWQVFGPLLRGWPAAGPGPWFWCGFGLGTFFLGFGLAAGQQLARALRRIPGGRRR
jgi:hypothetical protein